MAPYAPESVSSDARRASISSAQARSAANLASSRDDRASRGLKALSHDREDSIVGGWDVDEASLEMEEMDCDRGVWVGGTGLAESLGRAEPAQVDLDMLNVRSG